MKRWLFTLGRYRFRFALGILALGAGVAGTTGKAPFRPNAKAAFADPKTVSFVRPGLSVKVNSAEIAADGTVSVVFNVADPRGLPLDREGIVTPGTVALSFIVAHIPQGQQQYVSYTTRSATGVVSGTVTQAASDTGGAYTRIAEGQYRYVFRTKAPTDIDRSTTHTIGIYGSRNLQEFELGTNYVSTTFDFIPAGGQVATVRDIIRSSSCNKCHDELAAHGGSRRGVEMCVLCHTPQTSDPDTGNTMDLPVLVHKIHAGEALPSVQAGRPYEVVGNAARRFDWSNVVYPSDVRRCESCHEQSTSATQAMAHLTRPTRVACGSCHDDVNFATGQGHVAGPQVSDNQCATCHLPQGELEFDASIRGAHTIPQESTALGGLALELVRVEDGSPGKRPIVTFSIKDKAGDGLPTSRVNSLSLVMAGPTSGYGYTSFGSDVTTPGYVSEDARQATCTPEGTCTYTFRHAIPENARGSYSIGIESRRMETLLAGTTRERNVQYGAQNKVIHFTVDGTPVEPRRDIVSTVQCNQCHTRISAHGENRNEVAMCVLCHNPSLTDVARRPIAVNLADRDQPPQGVDFNLLIHRIHTGEHLKADGRPYVVVGFGGTRHDFSEVRYPAMSPGGAPGDLRNCAMCHINGSERNLTQVSSDVVDPQGPINPVKPITSVCTGCHVSPSTASHALVNTSALGESCGTCHSPTSQFSVARSHAQ
ncbi:MAG: OmcA/MtrC family decaheme c-type cytochrome [Bryobacteraceae bacterium]|nr:OmcA/MtrC family decaheme c-type cytochrome [Bryobacteraceae bacterium]